MTHLSTLYPLQRAQTSSNSPFSRLSMGDNTGNNCWVNHTCALYPQSDSYQLYDLVLNTYSR